MPRNYAILKVQRVKNWKSFSRRVNHCERTGKKLPANVDPTRQHLNERLFPNAFGPANGILRWHQRLAGRQFPDVLASEVRNLPLLVSSLNDPQNRAAVHLKSLLPAATQATLGGYKRSVTPLEPVKNELVSSLKAVIFGPSIYDRKRFKHVKLRDVTQQLLNSNPKGDAVPLLNRLLLEDAFPGALNPLVKPRENAVLAVEVFMGMSDDMTLNPDEIVKWRAANMTWLRARYGAENVLAGASNGDETTPHLHAVIMPMDGDNRLNCKDVLGDRKAMRDMQDDYWKAMQPFGLKRGVRGSRRQYIPQQELYEHRLTIKKDVEKVKSSLQAQLDQLKTMDSAAWRDNRAAIIAGVKKTMDAAQTMLVDMAGMAEEVILARRDEKERLLLFAKNQATDEIVAVARHASDRIVAEKTKEAEAVKQAAKTMVVEAQQKAENAIAEVTKKAEIKTQRADAVLKQQAALVRGLDLLPIAQDILALTPVEKGGVYTFTDANISFQINGRKFADLKDEKCRGSGAIDLVGKLTGRNFKEAVEYLLPRYAPAELIPDAAGAVFEETKAQIEQIKQPQPDILTLKNIPAKIREAVPAAWDKLRKKLVVNRHFDGEMLEEFRKQNVLWAVSDSVLAVPRTDFEDHQSPVRGVTLWDIEAPVLVPRAFAAQQGGVFWLGNKLELVDTIVGVANPLEALAYRVITRLAHKEMAPAERPKFPMILSLDTQFPTLPLFERLKKVGKKFVLATNTALRNNALAEAAPMLYGPDGRLLDWISLESAEEYLTKNTPHLAWTKLMPLKIQEALARNQTKQY